MAWSVMGDVPNPIFDANGDPYNGAVLKAYLPGTTTSTSIAIDSNGGSPQASITANAKGIWEVSGNAIIPFIDRIHKWGIFADATDAAANTPFYMGPFDNVPLTAIPGTAAIQELTTATMTANTNKVYVVGDVVETAEFSTGNGGGGTYDVVLTSSVTPNGQNIIIGIADAAISFVLRVDLANLEAAQFGATGDGSTDDKTAIQAAIDYAETNGGANVLLNSSKVYGVNSALNLGVSGTEIMLKGTGSKNGATLKALSAFTGGMVIISQGGVDTMSFTGFAKDTAGHEAIVLGTVAVTNPLVTIKNVLNNGGFYDFIKTIYEYDRAIIERVTSEVELGHAVMDLQTGGGFSFAASPLITGVSLRNPDSTRTVGEPKKFGIIIKRAESIVISGVVSNFDNSIVLDGESREPNLTDLLVLDLRSTPANDLWESAWQAATAYSLNDYRKPTRLNVNGHFYIVTTAGTSGGTEPTWPTGDNATVVDGTVTWTEVGESVNITVGAEQQVKINAVRSNNAIVALKNVSNANIEIASSRLVGEDAAILNVSGSNSEMQVDNCFIVGDVFLTPTGGGGLIRFIGQNNLISGDTVLVVPDHEAGSWSNTDYDFDTGNGPKFSGYTVVGSGATQVLDRYEDDSNGTAWVPTVASLTNTANAAVTSAYYTIVGNRAFCGIRGTVDITAANLESAFKLTVPIAMHSNTLSDVCGCISLTTGNADTAVCVAQSSGGGNNTDVAIIIPKKSIATAGDHGAGLAFFGNFNYKIL